MSPRAVLLLWATAVLAVGVLAVIWIMMIVGASRFEGERIEDPEVMAVLPSDFSPETIWRVGRMRSPSIMKLTIELTGATETYVIYPAYPAGPGDTPPVEQPFILDGGIATDVERMAPISIQPDSCDESCTVVVRLGDAHDVHVVSNGVMQVVEREAARVPSQHVVNVALNEPVELLEDVRIEVCIAGLGVTGADGLGRSITLQRRRSDQVGLRQVTLEQSTPWPLHRSGSRPGCQVEFTLGIEHRGAVKPDQPFDSVAVNVVHWGESSVELSELEVEAFVVR